ncbi:unnamed protein product [Didymodactylos carnosus]|uniref:Uncharacterized protein n=1 Tax=Didymodactylos carnosus TaxID=1234261 RepID=A0A813WPR8_9BILA|nr:unnamed protein product [Didymodactylos carnosus]CAF0860414.1 unnamed protein product [Didymodactylos carnosus]CAF3546893.1 unnamed protein product [Didymodactylos carnosus]CAF3648073.1 unnamed protein product [Didymodactylos carnosus]
MLFVRTFLRNFSTTSTKFAPSSKQTQQRNVALILSGCGVYDGAEIHEASACLVHLSRHNINTTMFAPNIRQTQVINHLTGETMVEDRNVLTESARIARGKIHSLDELKTEQFQAIVIPGGFGSAKNLSTFAFDNDKMKINSTLETILKEFIRGLKPVGLCCISPIFLAKLLPGADITMGKLKNLTENEKKSVYPYTGAVLAAIQMGANHQECDVKEICVDEKHRFVTTPAFMKNAPFHEVYDGIGQMIAKLVELIEKQ